MSNTFENEGTVIIPGAEYDPAGVYTGGSGSVQGGSGEQWGGESNPDQECNWPYVKKAVQYTAITTVPGTPGDPGQPYIGPTEAVVTENANAGWDNSCSSSIDPVGTGQQITFKVYHDGRGFFVGLDVFGKELQYIGLYRVGLRFSQEGVEIFESGVVIEKIKATLVPDDVFRIKRYNDGSVYYQVNDLDPVKSQNSTDPLKGYYAYGIGYQAGDIILEAAIESFTMIVYPDDPVEFDQVFAGYVTSSEYIEFDQVFDAEVGGVFVEFDQVFESLCENTYNSIGDLDLKLTVPLLHAEEGEGNNAFNVEIAAQVFDMDDEYVPPKLNELDLMIGPFIKNAEGVQVHTGELDLDVTVPLLHAEDEAYSSLDIDVIVPVFDSGQTPEGYMPLYNDLSVEDTEGLLKDIIIPLFMGLKAADSIQLFKDALLVIAESLSADDNQLIHADKEIAIREICSTLDSVRFSVDDLPDHAGGVAWVINVDTGATSIFLDYGFNSFMELDGIAYGVSDGGIHKLQETDAVVPSSGIDYGLSNFGSPRKKRIPHFYAAVASTGKVYLRLLVDGYKAEYFALSYTDFVEPNKINVGRGFHAVYWNPMIIAPEGVSIEELNALEWQPMVFPRRV
jgi:hypothetical protein